MATQEPTVESHSAWDQVKQTTRGVRAVARLLPQFHVEIHPGDTAPGDGIAVDSTSADKERVALESIAMVRELFVYARAYECMQDGDDPKMVLQEILSAGAASTVTNAVQRQLLACSNIEEHMQDKVSCLKRLLTLWRNLSDDSSDDKRIHRAVTLSGSKPKNFFDSLAVKVTNRHWMQGRWWQWKQWERVKVRHAELLPDLDLDSLEKTGDSLKHFDSSKAVPEVLMQIAPTPREPRGGQGPFVKLMGMFINTSRKVEYQVYWCGVQGLFEVPGQDPTRYMMILGEMCRAPPELFQTIVGQAMVRHHWTLTFYWGFCVDRVIDIGALYFLFSMASSTHVLMLPAWDAIYGLFFFSMVSMCCNMCAHIQCINIYKTLKPVLTFWNVVFAALDFLTVMALVPSLYTNYNIFKMEHFGRTEEMRRVNYDGSFFQKHPVIWSMLVAGKWFYSLLALLNLEFIGTAILPVWEAARSRQSLVFLAYLFMGTIACAHSYFTYAIDDIPDVTMAFFRMVRLTFLGDFDVMEIMGVDQHLALSNVTALYEAASLNNTEYNDVIVGGIDDDDQPYFSYGIRGWIMIWAFIGPVMFLNIYIGLLGSAYNEALADIEALFAKFRISNLMMYLLRRHFWLRPARNVCKFVGLCCFKEEALNYVQMMEQGPKDHPFKGYWISVPAKLIEEADDAEDVSMKLNDFSKQTEKDIQTLREENSGLKKQMSQNLAVLQKDNKELKTELSQVKDLLTKIASKDLSL